LVGGSNPSGRASSTPRKYNEKCTAKERCRYAFASLGGFGTKCPVVQHQRLPQAQAPLQIIRSRIRHTEMLTAHRFYGFHGRYWRSMIVNHWCALSCIRLVASFVRQISMSSLDASISQRRVSSWAIAAASPFSKV